MAISPVIISMFPTTFFSARIVTVLIISKYLTLTPVVVDEVVTGGKDVVEAEMVVGMD